MVRRSFQFLQRLNRSPIMCSSRAHLRKGETNFVASDGQSSREGMNTQSSEQWSHLNSLVFGGHGCVTEPQLHPSSSQTAMAFCMGKVLQRESKPCRREFLWQAVAWLWDPDISVIYSCSYRPQAWPLHQAPCKHILKNKQPRGTARPTEVCVGRKHGSRWANVKPCRDSELGSAVPVSCRGRSRKGTWLFRATFAATVSKNKWAEVLMRREVTLNNKSAPKNFLWWVISYLKFVPTSAASCTFSYD